MGKKVQRNLGRSFMIIIRRRGMLMSRCNFHMGCIRNIMRKYK
jgi:hypothetical protein